MRTAAYVISLSVCLILLGCTEVADDMQPGACLDTCASQEHVELVLQQQFGFEPGSYTIICSECNIGRGGFVRAKIEKDGEEIAVYTQDGWCSSGGTDCGWQRCISTRDPAIIERLKDDVCGTVVSYEVGPDPVCPGPQSDTTDLTRQQCRNGTFEIAQDGVTTFSIVQELGRCSAKAMAGGPCLAE